MSNTAFVQIDTDPSIGPFSVVLSQKCSTVVEHANFLRDKINQSQGAILDGKLKLDGPVALVAVLMDSSALIDYNIKLDEASMYTFHFKLATGEEAELVEQLATELAELKKKQAQQQCQLESLNGTLAELIKELAEKLNKCEGEEEQHKLDKEEQKKLLDAKMAQMEEKQAQDQRVTEQLAKEKAELGKLVKEQAGKMKELEKKMKLGEEKEQAAEYARLIGMPNVSNLKGNYNKEKMLNLLKHGNGIGTKLYIQWNQGLDDQGLIRSVADLLASAEKPEKLIGEVTIEADKMCFKWPQNAQLKLKGKTANVTIKRNEAFANPSIFSDRYLAEYELTNKDSRFQINMYYWKEEHFNQWVEKFLYRRLA